MSKYTGYTEAHARANREYEQRTYKKLTCRLRKEDDADIIAAIEEAQENGLNKREWLRELFDQANK